MLFGRLLDEDGNEIATDGHRLARELPLIHYRLDPGDEDTVWVGLTLSSEDQRSLSAGRYTVVIPLGDKRDEFANSVLISSGANPPSPLAVVVQPTTTAP